VQFKYRLIRVYEWDARDILEKGITCLAPFTPLMQQGIYQSIRKLLLHGIDANEVARLLEVDIQTVMTVAQSPEKEQ